jgi:hypothetical protein
MCEIDPKNRDILEQLVDTAPDVLHLYDQPNFLEFVNPISLDLIVANPPFHLQKQYLSYLNKNDVYDCDFLMRAKGLSFISNRQRRKEGTLRASGVGGDRTHAGPPQWSRVCPP